MRFKNKMFHNSRKTQTNTSMWVKKYLGGSKIFLAPKKSKSHFSLKLPQIESDFKNYFYLGLQKHH
jgi:hypothetical protein